MVTILELGSPKKAKITYALPDFGDEKKATTHTNTQTHTLFSGFVTIHATNSRSANNPTKESLLVYR